MFRHSQYPFLVVKDAIADTFRKEFDERPDVNIKAPQVMFDVYIRNNDVTVSLNTSGLPLFQRGYREAVGLAPLNEVVAAGLIRMSGWDRKSTFVDPFCGSGTILIEAALMAAGLPPQIERTHFAFKNFANFQPEVWEAILADVPKRITELPCKIIGSDISADMVTKARRNFRGLPIGRFIETSVNSFQELTQVEGPGVMISNPPYGERMGEEIEEMYEDLGNWMKGSMKGFSCWVLSSNMDALKFVGLRPDRKIKVFNGDLECSFRKFSIYEGSKKAKYMNLEEEVEATDSNDPKEEFQGKKHDKIDKKDWVRSDRSKRLEKKPVVRRDDRSEDENDSDENKPYVKKSYDRDGSSDVKKGYEAKKPEIPRRSTSKYAKSDNASSDSKPEFERSAPISRPSNKYTKNEESSSAVPSKDESRKVVIEPVVEKRPASTKYAKKEYTSAEPISEPKAEESDSVKKEPRKVVIEPVVDKRPASTKYAKKEYIPAEPASEPKAEESDSVKKEPRKVVIEPIVDKRPASTKYAKKESVPAEAKVEESAPVEKESKKVVIEPVVDERPASTKYAKKADVPAETQEVDTASKNVENEVKPELKVEASSPEKEEVAVKKPAAKKTVVKKKVAAELEVEKESDSTSEKEEVAVKKPAAKKKVVKKKVAAETEVEKESDSTSEKEEVAVKKPAAKKKVVKKKVATETEVEEESDSTTEKKKVAVKKPAAKKKVVKEKVVTETEADKESDSTPEKKKVAVKKPAAKKKVVKKKE
jgi:putative N6-adenine-specific DNA methylase